MNKRLFQMISSGTERKYLLLAVVLGIIKTVLVYKGFGYSDQVEQLPLLFRSYDPTFLENDFFTNVGLDSIARQNYIKFIQIFCNSADQLPAFFLILTFISNISIAVISFYLAKGLFKSDLAGAIASVLVMSVYSFNLGTSPDIFISYMIPSSLAAPFVLLAVLLAVKKRPGWAVLSSGLASIIHPLFGLETAALVLFSFLVTEILQKEKVLVVVKKLAVPVLLLTGFAWVSILPPLNQSFSLESEEFIHILAHFRHPHHYIPGSFPISHYLFFLAFSFAFGYAWYSLRHTALDGYHGNFMLILVLSILAACFTGYLFVEIIPVRIIATAQTFRLLYFYKWIGLIFIAGYISGLIDKKDLPDAGLVMTGVLHPITAGFAFFMLFAKKQLIRSIPVSKYFYKYQVTWVLVITFMIVFVPLTSIITLLLFAILLFLFSRLSWKPLMLSLAGITVLILILGLFHETLPVPAKVNKFISKRTTVLSGEYYSSLPPKADETFEFVRQNTPKEAVFLTPPNFGHFRFLAQRAIVVDFKSFPFTDEAMLEWYIRINDCYGTPEPLNNRGFDNQPLMRKNYIALDDMHIMKLQDKYDISYAILYGQTKTGFEVIFQNEMYQVIAIH